MHKKAGKIFTFKDMLYDENSTMEGFSLVKFSVMIESSNGDGVEISIN